jgi:hypothetical protein
VDLTDAYFAQNVYYTMSYHLGRTEEDAEVKKAVNEAQEYCDAQDNIEWVQDADAMFACADRDGEGRCKGNPNSLSEQLSLKIQSKYINEGN